MRATVMRDRRLVVDDIAEPVPGAGEVLVRTLACGICGSDLHALKHAGAMSGEGGGGMDLARDVVMGHEFCAEILDFGPGTSRRLPVGTRVCSLPMTLHDGALRAVGYSNEVPGGYGERMVLTESMLLAVPNGLPTEHAALTEPLAVGWHAVAKAELAADDIPVVIGCGPVGLAVINVLRLKGVHPIIAADYSPARRALAEQVGADIVLDPQATSPYASFAELAAVTRSGARAATNPLTGQPLLRRGVFFECVGVPGVLDQMLVGATPGCRFVVVGVCMEPDTLRPMLAITKEISMQFVLAYTPDEFATTLHHIAQGELVCAPLVTGKVGVAEVAQAFEELGNPGRHAKILVEPWR